jgi:transposase
MICDGKVVQLRLTLRDFRCQHCGVFREHLSGIDRRRTSSHYRQFVLPKVRDRSFTSVAKEHHLSPSSLIQSTVNFMTEAPLTWPSEPFALGVDEHSFSGRDLMITLTNLSGHRLLDILPNDRLDTLREKIKSIPQLSRKLITGICIDMKEGYRATLEALLPGIPIVVDKFHVISHFNWHLSELRLLFTSQRFPLPKRLFEKNREDLTLAEKQRLKIIFSQFPPLAEFWRMKEIMRAIYRMKDSTKARERFDDLLNGLSDDHRFRFQQLFRTLRRWKPYILNYFDHRITNAYTEGVHTRLKLLKRVSYGFRNKLNYIAKMTIAFLPLSILLENVKSSPCLT